MLAWSEGTDNGRQKTRNHGYDIHCERRAIYWLLRSPSQTCHINPKLKSTGAGRHQLLSRWWDAYRNKLAERLLEKSGRCGIAADWERRFTYDWSWWYPSGNRPLQQYLGFTAGRWNMVSSSIQADSLIAKFKEAGGTVREIDVWSRVTAIISALVICIIVCLSWAVNHYRDNAITYKAQRDKNARELKLANAAITDMQMRQRGVAALDAKYTKS